MLCSIGAIPILSVVPFVDGWLSPAVVDKFTAECFAARMKPWQPYPALWQMPEMKQSAVQFNWLHPKNWYCQSLRCMLVWRTVAAS